MTTKTTTPAPQGRQATVSRFFQSKKRPLEEDERLVETHAIEIAVEERHESDANDDKKCAVSHDTAQDKESTQRRNVDNEEIVSSEDGMEEKSNDDSDSRDTEDEEPARAVSAEVAGTSMESHGNQTTCPDNGSVIDSVNPFAKFAFDASSTSSKVMNDPPRFTWNASKRPKTSVRRKATKVDRKKTGSKQWVRMVDCSPEEQERIRKKWHSLADPKAPLEVRRFQVLVAARLHARCQEPVVRKAMNALRAQLEELNASNLSQCDPEVLANILSSLQYYNRKALHIVTAAKEIQSRFQGKVPESEAMLKQITGIGPVMADLLAVVNTVEAHAKDEFVE